MGIRKADVALDRFGVALLAAVVLLVSAPFLRGKYVFTLDFVVGPSWNPLGTAPYGFPVHPYVGGFHSPEYGGSLPLLALLNVLTSFVGPGVVQKLLLVGILSLVAAGGYSAIPGSKPGRFYAALVLLVNPFVYTRLLAGQWAVVWGLAMLPIAVAAYDSFLESGGYRNLILAVGAVTLLGFNAHLLYAAMVLFGLLTLFTALDRDAPTVVRRSLTICILVVPVNAYWLGPTILSGGRRFDPVDATDAFTYAPRGGTYDVVYDTATMHGFWRDEYVHARELVPGVQFLYVGILLLAIYGFLSGFDDDSRGHVVKTVGIAGFVGFLLATGTGGPIESVYVWAFENVPFFGGMRDSNKFVALLVLAYAYLGSLGVSTALERIRMIERSRLLSLALIALVLLTPLAYTFPMVTGYQGQVQTGDYPEDWYEVKQHLESTPHDGNVLVLPWHRYMDHSWLDGDNERIETPARHFYSAPVIQGDNDEVGPVYSQSNNPVSEYVEFLFGLGPETDRPGVVEPDENITELGELLVHANVEHVHVTKETDWRSYDAILSQQEDLSLVLENDHVKLYRNDHSTSRSYAVSEVRYVEDRSEFVAHSRNETTTDRVYAVDSNRAGEVETLGDDDREPLTTNPSSPAAYKVEGTTHPLVVMGQNQQTTGEMWRYDGDRPAYWHLGLQPVFESSDDSGTIEYAPYTETVVPCYLTSIAATAVLVGRGFLNRRPGSRLHGMMNRLRETMNR